MEIAKNFLITLTKKGYSYNELIFISSHLLSLLIKGINKEHKKTKHDSLKKTRTNISQPQNFLPTEELQNYKEILDVIKPYHHSKRDIIVTIAEIENTLEQARNLIQRLVFDTTRVSQSASCIRTSLDELNYILEIMQRS